MKFPTNDDFANSELSAEELEAIAAGWPHWLHTAVNFVMHEVSAVTTPVSNFVARHPWITGKINF
jgi:hypothetical protein